MYKQQADGLTRRFKDNKMRLDKAHIQKTLTETVLTLCQTGIPFDAELTVEGLLGITLDRDNIILVNIKEVIRHDMPKDYSTKGSEKRKAQVDPEQSNKRQKEAPRRMPPHSFIPEGYNSQEDSQDGNGSGSNGVSCLKIPLIPPEYVHAASQMVQMRQKQVKDVRQKHSEISRMLAVHTNNLPPNQSPRSSTSSDIIRCSPEMVQLQEAHMNKDGQNVPQSAINLAHDYISPVRSLGPFGPPVDLPTPVPINLEKRPDSGMSPMVMPTDLSVHAPIPRLNQIVFPGDIPFPNIPTSFTPHTPRSLATSHPIGVVLDTNVQPPAPLAVVAGTGMLQPMMGMGPKAERDFFHDLPEGTAIVQPVEIVPEEDFITSASGFKQERNNGMSKKDKALLQMGRPKKSKEFCRFRCTICNAASSRKFNLQRHVNSHHPTAGNCIVDLTPPKNPRQIRMKSPGDMKFHDYDSLTYGMVTHEGVSIDSVMDLSVSPSPDQLYYDDDDDEGSLTDTTIEDIPPPMMSVVGGTGVRTPVDEIERASTPVNLAQNLQRSPIKPTEAQNSPDAKKRFAKNKKSLDNMLFHKFGKYHSFILDEGEQDTSTDLARETNTPNGDIEQSFGTDVAHESDKPEEHENNEVELVLEDNNRSSELPAKDVSTTIDTETTDDEANSGGKVASETIDTETTEGEANSGAKDVSETIDTETTEGEANSGGKDVSEPIDTETSEGEANSGEKDVSEIIDTETTEDEANSADGEMMDLQTPEKDQSSAESHEQKSDASDSIATDANANNKNDLVVTQSNFSPDVNGNSKSTEPAIQESTSTKDAIPVDTVDIPVDTVDIPVDTVDIPVDNTQNTSDTCSELNDISAVKTAKLDKLSDLEAMLDFADNADNQSNDSNLVDENVSDDTTDITNVTQEQTEETNKKVKSVSLKDTTRVTRRSVNNNTEAENDDVADVTKTTSPLLPRKPVTTKAALREPIKTRTSTRSSSITTRRSSLREEIDAK